MKKVVIAFVAGAVVMFSAQAGAATLIGSKVNGKKDVKLNGKTIGQAAIIDGTSYLPVRSMANSLNLGVDTNGGTINLTSDESQPTPTPAPTDITLGPDPTPTPDIKSEKEILTEKLQGVNGKIWSLNKFLSTFKPIVESGKSSPEGQKQLDQQLEDYNSQLADLQKQKADLEAQLAKQN
ncbi:hypothetical protein [Cohnella nanjingensis]|uniref:Copper amine oxidase-like N-terminal domain-containing protein n=1 Tax=Cohnella nanjingensis TaxID=1387779 RepID=A0A7X0RS15_9BACL|nr:hypothetical protein [Cohnella nanjingensis]MBB6672629.1 hypothetical protein [Cohnella nanjingensis]